MKPGEVRLQFCSSGSPLEGPAAWRGPGRVGRGGHEGESLDLSSTSWLTPERSVLLLLPGRGWLGPPSPEHDQVWARAEKDPESLVQHSREATSQETKL